MVASRGMKLNSLKRDDSTSTQNAVQSDIRDRCDLS